MKAEILRIEPLEARIALAFAAEFDLATLNGQNGFQLSAAAAGDLLGRSVGGADVNGDGFTDLIVGADYADAPRKDSGAAYVIFGKAKGFSPDLDVSALDGRNGFRVSGASGNNLLGCSVSGAGDVNGDGIDDFILGARVAESTGTAYVIFGTRDGFPVKLKVSDLNGANGFKLAGEFGGAQTGESVSGAGDVNGDGFGDVIIGAEGAGPPGPFPGGAAYVVFGRASGFTPSLELSTLDGTEGFKLEGAEGNLAGRSVSGAGDLNGDGFGDVIIGAPFASPHGTWSGAAYVVFGKAAGFSNLDLFALDGSDGFKLSGEDYANHAGVSVSGAGDVNGDGFDDIMVGANRAFRGKAYIIFGDDRSYPANIDLSMIGGDNGFQVVGAEEGYDSGIGVDLSAAGDVNGDGIPDMIISADDRDDSSGSSFVVFGSNAGFPPRIEVSALDGLNGFKVRSLPGGKSSYFRVSGAGDMNGDGLADIAIGGLGENTRGYLSGAAYLIFGGDPGRLKIASGGLSATYTDPEGDKVTVTTSTGRLKTAMFDMRVEGLGFQLERLTLTDPAFTKTSLTFSAVRQDANQDGTKDGDREVNIGAIDATGVDLGRVKNLAGDLGQIDCGDGDPRRAALGSLKVRSLGSLDLATQDAAAASLHSEIAGDLPNLKVDGPFGNAGKPTVATLAIAGRLESGFISSLARATLSVLGQLAPASAGEAVAIGSLTLNGARESQILAGYDLAGQAVNPDVSIGLVTVFGDWMASDLVAGVADVTGDGFGRNDALIPGGNSAIIARIAEVTLRGGGRGTEEDTSDYFAITAEQLDEVRIFGTPLPLTEEKDRVRISGTGDFWAVEI